GSPVARRFGVPAGGWENYLRPSADVARPRFIRRTIFQAETCSLERSAHACGQAQITGHSISRLGADRSPASRTKADRERGGFTIGGRSVTFELNMNMPPNQSLQLNAVPYDDRVTGHTTFTKCDRAAASAVSI